MSRATFGPAYIDALLAALRAASGFRDPAASGTGIPVFDGEEVLVLEDPSSSWLAVGWTGDLEADRGQDVLLFEANSPTAETYAPVMESGEIACTVCARVGETDLAAARNLAVTALTGVDAVLRADDVLGIPKDADGSHVQNAERTPGVWSQRLDSDGATCLVTFGVRFQAVLT